MHAVIYARYSSSAQTEQSIEGQLRVCREYAEKNGIKIIEEYIDRAMTGTNDNRPAFLRMIEDSKKKQFEKILVYKLDRFSRNRYDNAIYKHKLQQYGVKVISATEIISDTPEGMIMESLLEMFAELYSKDLSQKVKRGMRENVLKGLTIGGRVLYGYKVENKKVVIDEEKAPAVKIMFEDYAQGKSKTEIVNKLNNLGYRTNKGKKFTTNSLQDKLKNEKYLGYYKNEYIESENYFPQIIDKVTFNKVQDRLKHNQRFGGKSKINFILSGKLYCGHCGASMIGTSGTSHTGKIHTYYTCLERNKRHSCNKKIENKDKLENDIIRFLKNKLLKPTNLENIASDLVKEYENNLNSLKIQEYENKIKAIDKQFDDITAQFIATKNQNILDRLNKQADDLTELQETYKTQLQKLKLANHVKHEKKDIVEYLKLFIYGNEEKEEEKQKLIDTFVNSIYVFDDYYNINIDIIDKENIVTFEEAQELLAQAKEKFAQQTDCSTKKKTERPFFICRRQAERSEEVEGYKVLPKAWFL